MGWLFFILFFVVIGTALLNIVMDQAALLQHSLVRVSIHFDIHRMIILFAHNFISISRHPNFSSRQLTLLRDPNGAFRF